jgi:Sec-independent protein translocase protein TatA
MFTSGIHLPELLLIFGIVLLLFGASRIGEIGGDGELAEEPVKPKAKTAKAAKKS